MNDDCCGEGENTGVSKKAVGRLYTETNAMFGAL